MNQQLGTKMDDTKPLNRLMKENGSNELRYTHNKEFRIFSKNFQNEKNQELKFENNFSKLAQGNNTPLDVDSLQIDGSLGVFFDKFGDDSMKKNQELNFQNWNPCDKKITECYSDRFIPMRLSQEVIEMVEFNSDNNSNNFEKVRKKKISKRKLYKEKLKKDLLGLKLSHFKMKRKRIFKYQSKLKLNKKVNILKKLQENEEETFLLKKGNYFNQQLPFSEMLGYYGNPCYVGEEKNNKIIKPTKTLEAPELEEDFYLNLLDYSSTGLIAISLKSNVFIWNSVTKEIQQIMKKCEDEGKICSLKFSKDGSILAVGDSGGKVRFFDCSRSKKLSKGYGDYYENIGVENTLNSKRYLEPNLKEIRQIGEVQSHVDRVGILDFTMINNSNILASGSRDSLINIYDLRISTKKHNSTVTTLENHSQEICGLAFSSSMKLASGGNENLISIFDIRKSEKAEFSLFHHKAAIKGLSFDPFNSHKLYSGGGNKDKTIKVFNTGLGKIETVIEVESQVTSILFSEKAKNQFLTTHGFSKNNLLLWDANIPKRPICEFEGHDRRVLYSALAPGGLEVVTGAGDETLKFWNVFNPKKERLEFFGSSFGKGVMEIR